MFSNRKWQQFALLLNLAGTALLFYSFQATSSDFKLVTAVGHSVLVQELYALCVMITPCSRPIARVRC